MRSGYCIKKYSLVLANLYHKVADDSKKSPLHGRLWSLPLGITLALTLPLVKIVVFLEDFVFFWFHIGNKKEVPSNLKKLCFSFMSMLLSPLTATFVGVAVFSSIFIDPVKSARRFAETCFRHSNSI